MKGALASFRRKVVSVQQFWRRLKRKRFARVQLMESAWDHIGRYLLRDLQAKHDAEQEEKKQPKKRRGSVVRDTPVEPTKSTPPKRKTLQPQNSKRPSVAEESAEPAEEPPPCDELEAPPPEAVRRPSNIDDTSDKGRYSVGQGAFFTEVAEEDEEDEVVQVPNCIRRQVLYEDVVQQQRSYVKRMKEWEEQREQNQEQNDLAAFSGSSAVTMTMKKPQAFELDHDQLEQLISQTFADWKEGKFKHIVQNHNRLVKKCWKNWLRAAGFEVESVPAPSKKKSGLSGSISSSSPMPTIGTGRKPSHTK